MSKLTSMSARPKRESMFNREDHPTPGQRTLRTRTDPRACPPGCDPNIWSAAWLFLDLAREHEHVLPTGVHLVCGLLEQTVDTYRLRPQKDGKGAFWRDTETGIESQPETHYGFPRGMTWQNLLERMIRLFWRRSDARRWSSINDFAGKHVFAELRDTIVTREHHRDMAARMKARREATRGVVEAREAQERDDYRAARDAWLKSLPGSAEAAPGLVSVVYPELASAPVPVRPPRRGDVIRWVKAA